MACEDHRHKYLKFKAELVKGSPLLAKTLGTPVNISLFLPGCIESKPLGMKTRGLIDAVFIDSTKVKGILFEIIYTKPQLNNT